MLDSVATTYVMDSRVGSLFEARIDVGVECLCRVHYIQLMHRRLHYRLRRYERDGLLDKYIGSRRNVVDSNDVQ